MQEPAPDLDFTDHKRDLLAGHLRRHVDGEVRFDRTSRLLYSTDASIYQVEPLGVVIPRTVDALRAAVQITTDLRLPVVPRGGGTSLSGQSIGRGVVIDCSKYLNRVLDIDPAARVARVQPGVILDQLNRAAAPHGLQFGPDVATATRANLGGMIGNNSAGARSIVYGKMIDHLRRLKVLFPDGSAADLGPVTPAEWQARERGTTPEANAYRTVRQAVLEHGPEIRRRFPKILRRVSGYNLDVFAATFGPGGRLDGSAGLHQLVVGSEGTLALVTEAELALVERPRAVGLLVPHFASLHAAVDATLVCLEHKPAAVELMDRMLIDLARDNLSLYRTASVLEGRPAAVLMVEVTGADEAEVQARLDKLKARVQRLPGVTAVLSLTDPAVRVPLWNLRSAAMPLLYGLPGDRKPITFVEDTAVAPERLPEFVAHFQEILRRHGTDGSFYGHASVGCLHVRPVLNLKDRVDVYRMRKIAEEVTDLVLTFGGSLSGEHGDGLLRSEWNRKMFGDAVYQAFCRVKQAFDPLNLFNPGKIVHAPPMTDNLRYGQDYRTREPAVLFDYARQEGFARAAEACNGAGVCRKLKGGTMCPSFRATRDEKDSTRGRANALRLALSGERPLKEVRAKWVYDVLDLCLMCKACKSECPTNVDMAKLKAEFLHLYYQGRLRPPGQGLMARVYRLYGLGTLAPRLFNRVLRSPLTRWLMERVAGIDRRRSLPPLAGETFRHWFVRRPVPEGETQGETVLLLDDCFTNFNEPEVGKAAVHVLEAAGCRVEPAGLTCCARPLISKGFLPQARDLIQKQAPRLAARVADGTPILGLEPSCLLTLADEWPELVPGEATQVIASAAKLADGWLADQVQSGRRTLPLQPSSETCVLHGHCHQKALVGLGGTADALKLVPGLTVQPLETGCCGMAGSFGYETEHYDVSVTVANLDLLPALKAAETATVVAPGTSCRHQIRDLTQRRALHPLEVLERALGEGE